MPIDLTSNKIKQVIPSKRKDTSSDMSEENTFICINPYYPRRPPRRLDRPRRPPRRPYRPRRSPR